MSPLEALRRALEAAVASDLRPQADAIGRLRHALDAYETSVRAAAERSIAQRTATSLGVSVLPTEPFEVPRGELASALEALSALLTPSAAIVSESQSGSSPRERTQPALDIESSPRAHQSTAQLRDPRVLARLIERAGTPPRLVGDVDLIDELEKLDMLSSSSDIASWRALTCEEQRVWLSYLVARARALRERAIWTASIGQRLRAVIVRFPTFARDTRPGHVNGMRPEHVPTSDSWHADALALYMHLRQLAGFDERCEERSVLARAKKRRIVSSESL